MSTDLCFVFGYTFATVVIVVRYDFSRGRRELAAPTEKAAERFVRTVALISHGI
jgi:hypothetical protein